MTAAVLHNMLRQASDDPELHRDPMAWMIERMDPERHPCLMKQFNFGQHRGIDLTKVPRNYLEWIVREGKKFDNQEAVVTARHALAGRFHPALMQNRSTVIPSAAPAP